MASNTEHIRNYNNDKLDALAGLHDHEKAQLIDDCRVFVTRTPDHFGGNIVTEHPYDWRKAQEIANKRGRGEEVEGRLAALM